MSYNFENIYTDFVNHKEKLDEVKHKIKHYSEKGFDTSEFDKEQEELEEKTKSILETFSREDLQKAVLLSYGIEI